MQHKLLILALLAGLSLSGAAQATPINNANVGNPSGNTIGNCSSSGGGNSSGLISASIACGDGTGINAAIASADVGYVGARATGAVGSLCCTSSVGGSATYSDSVIFSGNGVDPILVSMNLNFGGTLNSSPGGAPGCR